MRLSTGNPRTAREQVKSKSGEGIFEISRKDAAPGSLENAQDFSPPRLAIRICSLPESKIAAEVLGSGANAITFPEARFHRRAPSSCAVSKRWPSELNSQVWPRWANAMPTRNKRHSREGSISK